MPELNPQYIQFEKDVKALLEELTSKIRQGGFSDVELAQLASEIDFFEELRNLGFEDLIDEYFDNYDIEIAKILEQAERRGIRNLTNIDIRSLEIVRELDKEYLLGKASAWSKEWQSEFMKSIIRGETIPQTIKNLQEIPLTDAQLGTVLNTAYSDISRTATVEVYKDTPEQRFRYEGGVIPTSSEQCRWLMENQRAEGYTMAEIQVGIETPFGIIDESGRQPNFNCIHRWVAI